MLIREEISPSSFSSLLSSLLHLNNHTITKKSNGISSRWWARPLPVDRVDVLRLLLRHTTGCSENQGKGIKQILWEWPRPWSGTEWVSFNKYRRRTVRCRPTVHTWVKISSDTKLIPSFQIRSSLVPGQALPTATSPVEQKGSGWRSGPALPSAQTFPPTFPAKTNSLSEQETWGALQAVSTAQVNWAKKTETD